MRSILALALLFVPVSVSAQSYAHPLFVEAVRDPGSAEGPRSPKAIALGGVMTPATGEAVLAAPSMLLLGERTRVEVWGGFAGYQRPEVRLTPALISFDGEIRDSARSTAPSFGGVASIGRARWGAAAFVQSSAYSHAFETEYARLGQTFAHGTSLFEEGSGAASASMRTTRVGASVAVSPVRWISAGASVYLVNVRHDVEAVVDFVTCSRAAGGPTICSAPAPDTAASSIRDTAPGFAMSVTGGGEAFSITGRWRREPQVEGERTGLPVFDPSLPVTFDLPDVFGVSVNASRGGTMGAAEIAFERREGTFVADPDAPEYCGLARIPDCLGWGLGGYELENATVFRAGIEQRIASSPITLRAGYATEPARLVRILPDTVREDADIYERLQRISGGVALRLGARHELSIGLARDRHELLMTVGFGLR